jgi:hypothetical protein
VATSKTSSTVISNSSRREYASRTSTSALASWLRGANPARSITAATVRRRMGTLAAGTFCSDEV